MLKDKKVSYIINDKLVIVKKSIELVLTYKCNMNCLYCYERDYFRNKTRESSISKESIKKTIDFIYQVLQNTSLKENEVINIEFFGGEPTLEMELIGEFIQEFASNDKIGYFKIHTNGMLISKYIDLLLEWKHLTNNRIFVGISYDYKPMQYINRQQFINDTVLDGIKLIDFYEFPYIVKTTMRHKDLEYKLFDVYKDYIQTRESLKSYIGFVLTIDTTKETKANINLIKVQLDKILNYIKKNGITRSGILHWDKKKFSTSRIKCRSFTDGLICINLINETIYSCQGACFHPNNEILKLGTLNHSYEMVCNTLHKKMMAVKFDKECEKCYHYCIACPIDSITNSLFEFGKIQTRNNHCDVYALLYEYGNKFRELTKQ